MGTPAVSLEKNPVASFASRLEREGTGELRRGTLQILQVNLGKLCNQTCAHCHVDAGPTRKEIMERRTVDACLDVLRRARIPALDITGGAPEMNPHFRHLVTETLAAGAHVIDRCNLTILLEPGQEYLPAFLAENSVEIVSSLPCYLEENVDKQRGKGVFGRSIEALRQLNKVGYGKDGTGLALNLVYNPVGPHLPPPQKKLEADYRRELGERFGITFNALYTITNMPIARYARYLAATGEQDRYLSLLAQAFNPATLEGLMCRTTLSVGWDGRLYDCDFNQMLEIPLADDPAGPTIFSLDAAALRGRPIAVRDHCYGCTAGAGSSCGGVLA